MFLKQAFLRNLHRFEKFTQTWFAGMRVFQGLLGTTKTNSDLLPSMRQNGLASISTGIVMLLGIILTYIFVYIYSAKLSFILNVVEF
jgi:hypothetical protein